MEYSDIQIDKWYWVEYIDSSYPCDCDCHTDKGILHIMPCCVNRSYSGSGKIIQKTTVETSFGITETVQVRLENSKRILNLFPSSIKHLVNEVY